ncbi:hypothetical protein DL96DRAFT_1639583, partial [Flagelloscypha sp. PMI_526]
MNYNVNMEPLLPPELEQRIFSISAISDPRMMSTLHLISSRVNEWMEGIRFRSIVLNRSNFSSTIQIIEAKNSQFLAQHVRYCCIDRLDTLQTTSERLMYQLQQALLSFTGMNGLALWIYIPGIWKNTLLANLSRYPNLKVLSLALCQIPASIFPPPSSSIGITHITWDFTSISALEELIYRSQMPRLTHIQWNIGDDGLTTLEGPHRSSLIRIITFPRIQCVVMHIRDMTGTKTRYIDAIPELGHPSVVFFSFTEDCDFHDWRRMTSDKIDCWAEADVIIKARQVAKRSTVETAFN